MTTQTEEQFPSFLKDYGSLLSHFNNHFEGLNSYERGENFAQLTQKLVPHTTIGERFYIPTMNQHSYDKGIDLECDSKDGKEQLYIQAKYTIRNIDDLENIFSKFKTFDEATYQRFPENESAMQMTLLTPEESQ